MRLSPATGSGVTSVGLDKTIHIPCVWEKKRRVVKSIGTGNKTGCKIGLLRRIGYRRFAVCNLQGNLDWTVQKYDEYDIFAMALIYY